MASCANQVAICYYEKLKKLEKKTQILCMTKPAMEQHLVTSTSSSPINPSDYSSLKISIGEPKTLMSSHINSLPCHMVHTLTMYVDSTSHLLQLIIYCSLFERLQGVDLTSSYASRSKREWSCLRTLPRFVVSKTSFVVAV